VAACGIKEHLVLFCANEPVLPGVTVADELTGESVKLAADANWIADFNELREHRTDRDDSALVLGNDVELDSEVNVALSVISAKESPCLVGEGA